MAFSIAAPIKARPLPTVIVPTISPPVPNEDLERLSSPLGSSYAPASASREAVMRHRRLVSFAAGVALAAIAILPAMTRAQIVDVAIALAADVSLSIDDEEFELQRRGYAASVTDPRFVQTIQAGRHGAIALCFLEWAGPDELAA